MDYTNTNTDTNLDTYANMPYAAQAAPVYPAYPVYVKPENIFKPEKRDFVFALVVFVLGYLFSRWILFAGYGWGVAAFTTLYLLSVATYLMKKGALAKSGATWFWLGITWITGLSYAFWENAGFSSIRTLFLFCSAVYFVISASSSQIMGKTGNYLLIDGFNAVVILPFRNFVNQYVSFGALKKGEKKSGKALPVVIGLILALFLIVWLTPLLKSADSGGFSIILDFLARVFTIRYEVVIKIIVHCTCAIPIAAYIYGLVSGAAFKKGTDIIKAEPAKKMVAGLRFLQQTTVFIALGAVCLLYIIFIMSQLPYFFSAFTGRRPEGWLIYAEYARQGFFELCSIAAINLFIITIGNITCKKKQADSSLLKTFNIGLALITLVLIATAFSKMALYISAYGLTMPRLLPCVFMVFMAIIFVALIVRQKWEFSIVRFGLVTGSVMLCSLCLFNPDALVVRYNTDRYLSGTLREYDLDILYRAGYAGVLPAIEVYEKTTDEQQKAMIELYLKYQDSLYTNYFHNPASSIGSGINEYSVEMYRARQAIEAQKHPFLTGTE